MGAGVTSIIVLPLSYAFLYGLSRVRTDAGSNIWVNSFVQFQFFALGALLALYLRGRVPTLSLTLRIATFTVGLASWLIADGLLRMDRADVRPSSGSIVAGYAFVAIGCLLFLISFLGMLPRWLPRPLVYLGKISYGLYVFHMLCLSVFWKLFWLPETQRSSLHTTAWNGGVLGARAVLILLVSLSMTVMCAALSYRFLEQPFLGIKERFTFVRSRKA